MQNLNEDKEMIIVSRMQGNVIVMDLDGYNSIQKTLHLMSTKAIVKDWKKPYLK